MFLKMIFLVTISSTILMTSFCTSKSNKLSVRNPNGEVEYHIQDVQSKSHENKFGTLVVKYEVRSYGDGHIDRRFLTFSADCGLRKVYRVYGPFEIADINLNLVQVNENSPLINVGFDMLPPKPTKIVSGQIQVLPGVPYEQPFEMDKLCANLKKIEDED